MKDDKTHLVIFDGVCNLCNGIVQFIIRMDTEGKFKFATFQSKAGQSILDKFGLTNVSLDSIVYISGSDFFIKSSAVLNIFKNLGGFFKLAYVLIYFPHPFRDYIYNMIANSRYKIFGQRQSCMTPSPETKNRFL